MYVVSCCWRLIHFTIIQKNSSIFLKYIIQIHYSTSIHTPNKAPSLIVVDLLILAVLL